MATECYLYNKLYNDKVLMYDEVMGLVRLEKPTGNSMEMWDFQNLADKSRCKIRNVGSNMYLTSECNGRNVTVRSDSGLWKGNQVWLISECPCIQPEVLTFTDVVTDSSCAVLMADGRTMASKGEPTETTKTTDSKECNDQPVSATPDKGHEDDDKIVASSKCLFIGMDVNIVSDADGTSLTSKGEYIATAETKVKDQTDKGGQKWRISIAFSLRVVAKIDKPITRTKKTDKKVYSECQFSGPNVMEYVDDGKKTVEEKKKETVEEKKKETVEEKKKETVEEKKKETVEEKKKETVEEKKKKTVEEKKKKTGKEEPAPASTNKKHEEEKKKPYVECPFSGTNVLEYADDGKKTVEEKKKETVEEEKKKK